MKIIAYTLFLAFFFNGCSVKYDAVKLDENDSIVINQKNPQTEKKINDLSMMIQSLSPKINPSEAHNLAYTTTYYAMHLANTYDLVAPAGYHNYLINQNKKNRGLCYHWVMDILEYIDKKDYPSLSIYRVVSNKGEYFEHNAISVAKRGEPFDSGILLDAWRNSGRLFFTPVKEDKRYRWNEREKLQ